MTTTYKQTGNKVEDMGGNDLASITTPFAVTNNSTQGLVAAPTFNPVAGTYFGDAAQG